MLLIVGLTYLSPHFYLSPSLSSHFSHQSLSLGRRKRSGTCGEQGSTPPPLLVRAGGSDVIVRAQTSPLPPSPWVKAAGAGAIAQPPAPP